MDAATLHIVSALLGSVLNAAVYAIGYVSAGSNCIGCFAGHTSGKSRKTLSRARCLAAGIFLGTLFLGLMPAVRSAVQAALLDERIGGEGAAPTVFPVAETLIFIGFCGMLYVESVLMMMGNCRSVRAQAPQLMSPGSSDTDLIDSPTDSRKKLLAKAKGQHLTTPTTSSSSQPNIEAVPSCYDLERDGQDRERPSSGSCHRLVMLVGAMAVHSVFDGLTLGLQDSTEKLARLVLGVYLHESLMVMAVALNAASTGQSTASVVGAGIVVAAAVPVGQMVGLMLGSEIDAMAKAMVQAMAAGTFFHVTFMEVLPRELGRQQDHMVKVTCMIAGFALIATTNVALGHPALAHG